MSEAVMSGGRSRRRPDARALIAGATGYIGRRLALRLAEEGEPPRVMARDRSRAKDLEQAGCEVVEADVLEAKSLTRALGGVSCAYYLVHSMGRGGDEDFAERDQRGAENFASAASEASVERIVYLGGLADEGSHHLESRHATATHLGSADVPVTYLRAAAVIGAGSESFRTAYYLVRRLPLMITPRWVKTKTQPIAIRDVLAYLAESRREPKARGRTIEIGGPDVTTYGGMMDELARAMGMRPRPKIGVPALTPYLSSLWIGLVTPVDTGVARPLVQGLGTETVVRDPSGMDLFDVERTSLDEAMRLALDED